MIVTANLHEGDGTSWYPRNLLAGKSWVRVPAFATFSSEMEFFLSLSFLPVESASACVHSGKEVAGPLLTLETTDQHRRRMGVGASGRGAFCVTTVQSSGTNVVCDKRAE